MANHPTDTCYNHIIIAGIQNIQRLVQKGDLSGVQVEADHLAFVAKLLDTYLHKSTHGTGFDVGMHNQYWYKIRIEYVSKASPESQMEMDTHWYMLASNLGFDYT